jgi:hypothetical protein
MSVCETCNGDRKCIDCQGMGWDSETEEVECSNCSGTGECSECHGSGRAEDDDDVEDWS